MTGQRHPGELPDPEQAEEAGKSQENQAVERFDQQGRPDEQNQGGRSELTDATGSAEGANAASLLMEQWLHQIEGNPAYLLRRQFGLEEQRLLQRGGAAHEPRPW
jgi:hypothetical protein